MFSKAWFWILMVVLAIGAVFFNLHYANKAFNLLNIEISMSRRSATAEADKLHGQLGIKLDHYRRAVAFSSDDEFQNYVELRAGGKKVFQSIIDKGDFHPYFWQVRHFKQHEARELMVYFTPAGKKLGFEEKVPESEKGISLTRDEARVLADSLARTQWGVALERYTLIEQAQDTRPNGRIDHTFTYERSDLKYAEAHIRLKLVVSGNRLSTLYEYAKVPEQFTKEYEEMRSYNMMLSAVALALMVLLYGVTLLVWMLVLQRRQQLIWKPAMAWGAIIGVLVVFAGLNYISFEWFAYNTANSMTSFLLQQILTFVINGLVMGILAMITIVVAEAVTRKAMPGQVQLWKVFSRDTAPTRGVLGRVLGGYLIMPIELAYVIGFYAFTQSRWGWWSPASSFSDPNILGSFSPFISAIGQALQAGFWEESMFRAIPLATMLILGTRLNKKWLFLVLGMVLQALVFSSGHAGYPQQPFYSRIIELTFTSLLMGFVYLRFGLLPAIIWHFSFDALMMNISSLVSTSPDLIPDHILFGLLFFLPLIIVLWRKAQTSKSPGVFAWLFQGWGEVPESSLNRSWNVAIAPSPEPQVQAAEPAAEAVVIPDEPSGKTESKSRFSPFVAFALALFVTLSLLTTIPEHDVSLRQKINGKLQSHRVLRPRLKISTQAALQKAGTELQKNLGITAGKEFTAYPDLYASSRDERYFVMHESGYGAVKKLRNRYYLEDGWRITYKRFTGTLQQRSEQYQIDLTSDGAMFGFRYILPEATALPSLDEAAARAVAIQWIIAHQAVILPHLQEISAIPQKLPHRTDWTFIWADHSPYLLQKGEARLKIVVAGYKVSELSRYVFIPEGMQRTLDHQSQAAMPYRMVASMLLVLTMLAAAAFALFRWSRGEFNSRAFVWVYVILGVLSVLKALVTWKLSIGGFSTAEPYGNQMVVSIIGIAVRTVFLSGILALICGWGFWWLKHRPVVTYDPVSESDKMQRVKKTISKVIMPSMLPVFALYFVQILVLRLIRGYQIPGLLQLPNMSYALASLSSISILFHLAEKYFLLLGVMVFLMYLTESMTARGTRRKVLIPLVWLLVGLVAAIILNLRYLERSFVISTGLFALLFFVAGWVVWASQRQVSHRVWFWCSLVILAQVPLSALDAGAFVHAVGAHLIAYGLMLLLAWGLYRYAIEKL